MFGVHLVTTPMGFGSPRIFGLAAETSAHDVVTENETPIRVDPEIAADDPVFENQRQGNLLCRRDRGPRPPFGGADSSALAHDPHLVADVGDPGDARLDLHF